MCVCVFIRPFVIIVTCIFHLLHRHTHTTIARTHAVGFFFFLNSAGQAAEMGGVGCLLFADGLCVVLSPGIKKVEVTESSSYQFHRSL